MVTARAVQRGLHFFFPVSSCVLFPEVELNRQMRVVQFNASERDNSFSPTCTTTKLIIKLLSLCFITTVLDMLWVLFHVEKVQQKSHELLSREKFGGLVFLKSGLLIRKMTFGLPEGW